MKHGIRHTRLYSIWCDMKKRCNNKNRKDAKSYSLKGIRVCSAWENNPLEFYNWAMENGYDDSLTIDRINTNGNYEPSNCRWADKTTQARNSSKRIDNTSGYVGVGFRKDTNKWQSYLAFNGKTKKLGCFNSLEEAVKARNEYIICNKLSHSLNTIKE